MLDDIGVTEFSPPQRLLSKPQAHEQMFFDSLGKLNNNDRPKLLLHDWSSFITSFSGMFQLALKDVPNSRNTIKAIIEAHRASSEQDYDGGIDRLEDVISNMAAIPSDKPYPVPEHLQPAFKLDEVDFKVWTPATTAVARLTQYLLDPTPDRFSKLSQVQVPVGLYLKKVFPFYSDKVILSDGIDDNQMVTGDMFVSIFNMLKNASRHANFGPVRVSELDGHIKIENISFDPLPANVYDVFKFGMKGATGQTGYGLAMVEMFAAKRDTAITPSCQEIKDLHADTSIIPGSVPAIADFFPARHDSLVVPRGVRFNTSTQTNEKLPAQDTHFYRIGFDLKLPAKPYPIIQPLVNVRITP